MLTIRAILCPTDFSESARHAFRLAVALARDQRARLLVLHVATPPPLVSYGELQRSLEQTGGYRHELENQLRQVHDTGSAIVAEYRVVAGDPGAEITSIAKEATCDLIVMGTHGRTGLGRLLIGSVAEQVLRRAHCPVLTIKVPQACTPPAASGPADATR
jgi:nucleotide-binding universal stress UspA family protein